MKNICELCDNKVDGLELNGKELRIKTSQWSNYYGSWIWKTIEINYCPMCGRKLSEENYSKLDYLYDKYECNDLDTLKARCPINLKLLDLESKSTLEFEIAVDEIEEKENEDIAKVINERDKNDDGKRYSL